MNLELEKIMFQIKNALKRNKIDIFMYDIINKTKYKEEFRMDFYIFFKIGKSIEFDVIVLKAEDRKEFEKTDYQKTIDEQVDYIRKHIEWYKNFKKRKG